MSPKSQTDPNRNTRPATEEEAEAFAEQQRVAGYEFASVVRVAANKADRRDMRMLHLDSRAEVRRARARAYWRGATWFDEPQWEWVLAAPVTVE